MNSYQPAIEKQNNINIGLNSYSERVAAEAISPIIGLIEKTWMKVADITV